MGEQTAAAFLGIRLECAQCHKHPFDRWTQTDYRAYANIFGQVAIGMSPGGAEGPRRREPGRQRRQGGKPASKAAGIHEVFVGGKGRRCPTRTTPRSCRQPEETSWCTGPRLPAKALGGPVIPLETGKDARVALFEWMRSPDNPYFARSFVNRVWGHYFGVGLVDPVDNFSLANPPSNDRLLDALAKDFVEHRYDIRRLERTILNSRIYQLSSTMNETNKLDRNNYSHSFLRPMMAEVVVDVLDSALGVPEDFGTDAPPGSRAIEVGSSRVHNANLAYAFRTFGRPTADLGLRLRADHGAGPAADALPDDRPGGPGTRFAVRRNRSSLTKANRNRQKARANPCKCRARAKANRSHPRTKLKANPSKFRSRARVSRRPHQPRPRANRNHDGIKGAKGSRRDANEGQAIRTSEKQNQAATTKGPIPTGSSQGKR